MIQNFLSPASRLFRVLEESAHLRSQRKSELVHKIREDGVSEKRRGQAGRGLRHVLRLRSSHKRCGREQNDKEDDDE